MKRNPRPDPPAVCPVCGEDVPPNARACPQCGADHRSGWNEEETGADGLDLPDEDFDYDAFMEREFGARRPRRGLRLVWWIAALVLILALGYAFLAGRW